GFSNYQIRLDEERHVIATHAIVGHDYFVSISLERYAHYFARLKVVFNQENLFEHTCANSELEKPSALFVYPLIKAYCRRVSVFSSLAYARQRRGHRHVE